MSKLLADLGSEMANKMLFLTFLATYFVSIRGDAAPAAAAPPLRCQAADKTFLPSATSCEDEVKNCAETFKTALTKDARDPLCDNDLFKDVVTTKCAKTCGVCCENPNFSCEDDPAYAKRCPDMKTLCTSTLPGMKEKMAKLCPATCGLCAQSSCRDALPDCATTASLCNDVNFGDIWKQQCARTCNSCSNTGATATVTPPATPCLDSRANCAQLAGMGFCTNQFYMQKDPTFIRRTCGKSCKMC
ncbi:hypothetical protein QR680_010292 [Steinernema hermaphroditum]|uniref:ShKT domain-containing protein n=1 Tax=Steinernema hermaphroditum TaxID=289476 RepID=A0AA39IR43_9BILA|nr:hypothetical protein QR680_010292 [Steinernema hermaphroditum]